MPAFEGLAYPSLPWHWQTVCGIIWRRLCPPLQHPGPSGVQLTLLSRACVAPSLRMLPKTLPKTRGLLPLPPLRSMIVYGVFNSFPDYSDLESWEGTLKGMASTCCCTAQLESATTGGGG